MILKFLLKNFGKTSVLPVLPKYGYVPGLSLAFRRLALLYTKWDVMIYKRVSFMLFSFHDILKPFKTYFEVHPPQFSL